MINVREFIKVNKLSKKDVANILFPKNKHPQAALDRVIRGEGELKESQVAKLRKLTNKVGSGFDNYKVSFKKLRDHMVFKTDSFQATLNMRTLVTNIITNDKMVECTTVHEPNIPLKEYLESIAHIINTKKAQEEI